MSDGANKALLANPKHWLANNIIIIEINPTNNKDRSSYLTTGTTLAVNLVKAPDTGTKKAGGSAPVWKLVRGNAVHSKHSHQFDAYFLPWNQNDKKTMVLNDPNINWFFTDTMNGCTFAAGPGPTPKVGHFNYQVDNTKIDDAKINTEVTGEFRGGTFRRLDKKQYMDKDGFVKVTTLGIRTGTTWAFYYQVRSIVSLIPPKWELPRDQPKDVLGPSAG